MFATKTEIPPYYLDYLNSGLAAGDMSYMFDGGTNLRFVPKLNIDTSQCTSMRNMFAYCNILESVDLSNFNTSNVTDMSYMFYCCNLALRSLDLSNFNTSKVTDMRSMFAECDSLKHIEAVIDMKSCTNYSNMFNYCTELSGVKIKNPPAGFDGAGLASNQYTIVS